MRKTLELLALSTCTAALCVTLTGCEAVKGTASGEKPVKTVYVYLPDGTLLDKGRADKVSSFAHNDRIRIATTCTAALSPAWAPATRWTSLPACRCARRSNCAML